MSIASAITAAQGKVANAYTAVSNKGGTLPQTQNLSNLPTAINSIPSGGGQTKYGCTIDNLLGDVDSNGVLQLPTDTSGDIVFKGVKDIASYGLTYRFYQNTNLTGSVSFPDLEDVTGTEALYYTFAFSHISSVSLPKLKTIINTNALNRIFYNTLITTLSLPELTTISSIAGCSFITGGCANLVTAYFPKLSSITTSNSLQCAFYGCTALTDVYFNSLTTTSFGSSYTNQFNNMMNYTGTNVIHTLHFPSNMESTIQGLSGYPLFGGTSGYVVLAFDLPETS